MHTTVLLSEAVDALDIDPAGIYIDGTFGRGGHSKLILDQLTTGRLIAIDKDPEAIAFAHEHFQSPQFEIVQASFGDLKTIVSERDLLGQINGVLVDLGVSSPQIDQGERGFSFMKDGPLDMRMNPDEGESVASWLSHADEKTIADVIYQYGEEKLSRRIAKKIVETRVEQPITTTLELAQLVSRCIPKKEKNKHPATRTFQGLRIFINNELGDLETLLDSLDEVLIPGGRFSAISFHSLEDRIVKQFLNAKYKGPEIPRDMPIANVEKPTWRRVIKLFKTPDAEKSDNPRARSAILRVGEKCL